MSGVRYPSTADPARVGMGMLYGGLAANSNPVCRFWDWADTLGARLPTVDARKLISHLLAESASCVHCVRP